MFYYAKLNQSNICTSIETSIKKLEERTDLLRQQDYNPTIINRKWLGDQWSQETYEDVTELERLRDENTTLKSDQEAMKVNQAMMQAAIDDLILNGGGV